MADFTYDIPNEQLFFNAVRQMLLKSGNDTDIKIGDKLNGAKCSIVSSSQFSRERWNAYSTEVHFYVPLERIAFFDRNVSIRLLSTCDRIMPKNAGYDIQRVEFAPILEDISSEITLTRDLEEIQSSIANQTFQLLPDDIKDKGKEMAEVYTYLYCVENSIRLFIDKTLIEKSGSDYLNKIAIPTSVKKSIQVRRDLEAKNQWISIRGKSDLFYLDFKELANLIIANWDLFKEYFPDQHWLNVKIEELGNCRNLIAHNSYVNQMERDIIRLNYNQILKQVNRVELEKSNQVSKTELDDLLF
jgi:hypothetical protein